MCLAALVFAWLAVLVFVLCRQDGWMIRGRLIMERLEMYVRVSKQQLDGKAEEVREKMHNLEPADRDQSLMAISTTSEEPLSEAWGRVPRRYIQEGREIPIKLQVIRYRKKPILPCTYKAYAHS